MGRCAIRFVGICKGRDPFCWFSDWCNDPLIDHVLGFFFNLFSVFSETFL